jgi:hypothetical protein
VIIPAVCGRVEAARNGREVLDVDRDSNPFDEGPSIRVQPLAARLACDRSERRVWIGLQVAESGSAPAILARQPKP